MNTHSDKNGEGRTAFFSNPYLLLILTTFFWGGNAVAGKLAVGEISFAALTFFRWLVAFLLLLPFAWPHILNDREQIKRSSGVLFVLGGLGFAGFNLMMYWALTYTSVVNVVIEQASIPALVMLINFVVFRQSVPFWQPVGLVLTLLGVVLTVSQGNPFSLLTSGVNQGDAIMMIAALCYVGYSLGLAWKPAIHWLSFMLFLCGSAVVVSGVVWSYEVFTQGFHWPSRAALLLILYTGVFPSLVSQLFYARGVELIGANRASLFINMVPIFGSILAIFLLGEAFRWFHMAGLLFVVGGIVLAEQSKRVLPKH